MDQNNVQPEPIIEPIAQVATPATVVKGSGGHRNLILAIVALVTGAAIISGVIVVAYPKQEQTPVAITTTPPTQISAISKASDLNTASSEINAIDLDSYKADLIQIDSAAAGF